MAARKAHIIENDVNETRSTIGTPEIMVKLNILVELANGKDRKWESGQKEFRGMHETRCIGSLCEGSM